MQFQSLDGDNSLEEEMITHSIILTKMISEKPDGLKSIGSHIVGHERAHRQHE